MPRPTPKTCRHSLKDLCNPPCDCACHWIAPGMAVVVEMMSGRKNGNVVEKTIGGFSVRFEDGSVADSPAERVFRLDEVSFVDHPSHYGGAGNPYEAIKVIEAWQLGFCLGNAVKYIARAGRKDPEKIIEDLEKARWYLDREIGNLKKS